MHTFDIALNHFYKFGPVSLGHLKLQLGSSEAIWRAPRAALLHDEVPHKLIDAFIAWRGTQDPLALEAAVHERGLLTVSLNDAEYPTLLKTIYDPPHLLYYRGTLPSPDAPCLGVVGSRKATQYGLLVAHDIAQETAAHGIVIVSGLAQGIDEAAHVGALDAKGKTVAILAHELTGGDSFRKQKLAARIVDEGGAVMTEFLPDMPPLKQHFPIRNRIIAGMSKGTLVVEAGDPSGSLITARAALNEGRDLLAVPGPITSPASQGTNRLCKEGAHVITSANDILHLYDIATAPAGQNFVPTPEIPTNLSEIERTVLAILTKQPVHIDVITRQAGLASDEVSSLLTGLEIQGLVRNVGGMRYIR